MPSPKPPASSRTGSKTTRGKLAATAAALPLEKLEDLRDLIEIFLVDHPRALLSEPGRELLDLSDGSFSLDTQYGKLIWHIWNDRTNLVRQITGLAKEKPGRLELYYQRFGKGPPGTLIVADTRADADALNRRGRRLEYLGHLRRWLAQLFPGIHAEGLTTEASLKDSLSGCYARGMLHEAGRSWALIGVGPEESPEIIDGVLTYGIIWLDLLRQRNPHRVITGLKVFVPHGFTDTTRQRLAWMNRHAALWELYETGSTARLLDSKDAGNLRTRLQPPRPASGISAAGDELMKRIESLDTRVARLRGGDGLLRWSVNGLVFARQREQSLSSPIVYGLGRAETLLDERSLPRLERLVGQVLKHRRAQVLSTPDARSSSAGARHPLYRLQPEQWLESAILASPDFIVPDVQRGSLRAQVFSVGGREQGLADLIGMTQAGRLVVMELKVGEDIHLPMQALDYWIVAHWHLERGSFAKDGFFVNGGDGRAPVSDPPRLLLVGPALQFHSTCATILRYFSPEIEAEMVGLNEGWREQLQVVFRKSSEQ